jgi:hypothetical protein
MSKDTGSSGTSPLVYHLTDEGFREIQARAVDEAAIWLAGLQARPRKITRDAAARFLFAYAQGHIRDEDGPFRPLTSIPEGIALLRDPINEDVDRRLREVRRLAWEEGFEGGRGFDVQNPYEGVEADRG